ncbi:MAG: response regulator [Desulfobulbaceae bacterium]|nr:response regulator [Desulfobulbaceae bacterium]
MKVEMLSLGKAAEICAITRGTLWSYVKSGDLKASRTPGGHYRVAQKDIDEFILQKGMKAKNVKQLSTGTILIVDDEASVRKTLKQKLVREGFVAETAPDGFNAGLKARDIKPGLIILDLMMNGIDGFEVCRAIKKNSTLKKTKILIMTGFDTPENRERAIREGADGYLTKGVSFEEILERINKLLAI